MRVRYGTAGTLLQVLELLLAVRSSTSGGDGQLSETASSAIPDPKKNKSPAQAGSAVLRLLWLADPARSRCPPIRYAMLHVLQVGRVRAGEGGIVPILRTPPVAVELPMLLHLYSGPVEQCLSCSHLRGQALHSSAKRFGTPGLRILRGRREMYGFWNKSPQDEAWR